MAQQQQGPQPSPRPHLPHPHPSNNNKSGKKILSGKKNYICEEKNIYEKRISGTISDNIWQWHLTTTDQVGKYIFSRKDTFFGVENCEFIGRGLICSEVGHKNELSCRGVVVRTTSTSLHSVCIVRCIVVRTTSDPPAPLHIVCCMRCAVHSVHFVHFVVCCVRCVQCVVCSMEPEV